MIAVVITVVSWNMHQRRSAWGRLETLVAREGVAVAMVQEARRPEDLPDDWQVYPPADQEERWRVAVPRYYRRSDGTLAPTRRPFASAVIGCAGQPMHPREPTELHAVVDGDFAASHPGQFAVASVGVGEGRHVTVISLYGIWDRVIDSRDMYPEATLHRAISDLTVVFEERGAQNVLLAGDLNIYSYSDGSIRSSRAQTVLARLGAYGLELSGPFRTADQPRLAGCPCPDPACRHVQTYMYQSNPKNRPHQLDFFLATPDLRERLTSCWADPDPAWPDHSDHRPIFARFDLQPHPLHRGGARRRSSQDEPRVRREPRPPSRTRISAG